MASTSFFFLVCSLPYCLIYHKSNIERSETDFTFTLIVVHILSYSNNSFNFVFYYLFSEKYREELSNLFWTGKIRNKKRNAMKIINNYSTSQPNRINIKQTQSLKLNDSLLNLNNNIISTNNNIISAKF